MQRALWLTLVLLFCSVVSQAAADKPNILFICTDDQGAWTTGFSGNKDAHTPNLDRLRREGAWLTNSLIVTPVCSPSRAATLTSRYSSETGIYDWIKPAETHGLPENMLTWPQMLQKAGYKTGLVGKWHVGHTAEHHPTKRGYGYFMGLLKGGCATKNPTLEKDGQEQAFEGLAEDIFTDHALSFIEQHRAEPFALSLHFRAPHTAYLPVRDEDLEHIDGQKLTLPEYPDLDVTKTRNNMRAYLASVACVDRNVGRVLKLLDDLKLADNTLVIFTSDHGYNVGQHGIWHKGNATWMLNKVPAKEWPNIPPANRPNMFDTSLRLPTVVRWPGCIKPGSTISQTVTNLDWFPTLCAVAEASVPENMVLRGRSIVPLLDGKPVTWNNDYFGEYNMRNGATTAMRCYRTPEWKLMIDFANPGRSELYHLSVDPEETKNLAKSDDPEVRRVRANLEAKLRAKMSELGDSEEKATR